MAVQQQKMSDFLDQLTPTERTALVEQIDTGRFAADAAAQCLTSPGVERETAAELLVYLSNAIRSLDAARALVAPRATDELA
jgi:hypothetical protein